MMDQAQDYSAYDDPFAGGGVVDMEAERRKRQAQTQSPDKVSPTVDTPDHQTETWSKDGHDDKGDGLGAGNPFDGGLGPSNKISAVTMNDDFDPYAGGAVSQVKGQTDKGDGSAPAAAGGKPGFSSRDWQPELYKPNLVEVPKPSVWNKLQGAGHPGGVLSIIGAGAGNQGEIAQAQAHNELEQKKYEQSIEAAKIQAGMHNYRNMYGATGNQRPSYVQGDDGKPHLQRYNPQTGSYDVSPEVAVIPGVATQEAKNNAPQKSKGTDQLFADVLAHPMDYDDETQKMAAEYAKRKASFAPQRAFAPVLVNPQGGGAPLVFDPNKRSASPLPGASGPVDRVAGRTADARPREDSQENRLRADAAAESTPGPATAALNNYVTSKARSRGKMPDQKGAAPALASGAPAPQAQPHLPPNRKLRINGQIVQTDANGKIIGQ